MNLARGRGEGRERETETKEEKKDQPPLSYGTILLVTLPKMADVK